MSCDLCEKLFGEKLAIFVVNFSLKETCFRLIISNQKTLENNSMENSFVSIDNVDIKAAPNYTMLYDKLFLSTVDVDVSDENANNDEH